MACMYRHGMTYKGRVLLALAQVLSTLTTYASAVIHKEWPAPSCTLHNLVGTCLCSTKHGHSASSNASWMLRR
jgi:hypothetical protein